MLGVKSEVKVVLQDWESWQGQEWAWQETSKDLMSGRGNNGRSGLGLQCAGWDPAVQTLLGGLEAGLGTVWTGVEQYCTRQQDTQDFQQGEEETTVFNRFGDSELIRKSTGETIQAAVAQLVKDCRREAETLVEESSCSVLLILGRILQAVLHLCPSLTSILDEDSNLFKAMKKLLDKEAESCFSVWIESRLRQFSSSLSCISWSSPLSVIPTWDNVTIEETGDSGDQVSSLIRIPASPSLPLHSAGPSA